MTTWPIIFLLLLLATLILVWIFSDRARRWLESTKSLLDLMVIVSTFGLFIQFFYTVVQYREQRELTEKSEKIRRQAQIMILQEELKRNLGTANFVINACAEMEKGEMAIPYTIYVDSALKGVIEAGGFEDEALYFNLVALEKLLVISNRNLENAMALHNIELVARQAALRHVREWLNENARFLRKDAEDIKKISSELLKVLL